MSLLDYLGRFHPVLVHLPIGFLLAAVFLECLSSLKGYKKVRKAVRFLLLIGFAAALFTSLTGWLHADSGEFDAKLVKSHRALGIVLTLFSLVALILHGRKNKEVRVGYFIVLFTMTIMIVLTGHSGGTITHGTDFLKPPDAEWWEGEAPTVPVTAEARIYADLVAPVLKKKCEGCHGPSRQKGKLRLDLPEYIQQGGKDGNILEGHREEGEMWRRITLDSQEDDHMPPIEKKQLTSAEITLITYWLQTGANFREKLGALPGADSLITVINTGVSEEPARVALEPVPMPDEQLLDEIRKAGINVSFLSQGDGRLSLQCINADPAKLPALLPKLSALDRQLMEVKMQGLKLSHQEWSFLRQQTHLQRANLEGSNFEDDDLHSLVACTALKYLNLVGTSITAAGLKQLAPNQLEQLFLYRTAVKSEDLIALQQQFPKTNIVLGNFAVSTLVSDTTLVPDKRPND